MADFNISPNMSLLIPSVGVDPGPDWANNLNASLTIIDSHNHSAGSGVPITPDGISITIDLPFNTNNATGLRSSRYVSQVAPLALASDLTCVYSASGELWYNDDLGNQVQITLGGAVAGTPGSISNLVPPASASYNSGTATFIFQSAANTSANIDGGSLIIRENVAAANGITISSPTALSANYTLTLPGSLPGAQKFVTLDSSGNIAAPYVLDNITIQAIGGVIQVPTSGISSAQIGAGQVTQSKLQPRTISTTVGTGGVAVSTVASTVVTSTSFTDVGFSNTITTTGRPVMVSFQVDPTAVAAGQLYIGTSNTSLTSLDANFQILKSAAQVSNLNFFFDNFGTGNQPQLSFNPGSFNFLDTTVNGVPGTYTYTVSVKCNTSPMSINFTNIQMMVYEI